mmetsp:Transcript_14162/g.30278  ORF Transcript_14162/g.30278 Transcript_14162/m.30278 type:complete len:136 (-) Transcript_14162:743-1150(-)
MMFDMLPCKQIRYSRPTPLHHTSRSFLYIPHLYSPPHISNDESQSLQQLPKLLHHRRPPKRLPLPRKLLPNLKMRCIIVCTQTILANIPLMEMKCIFFVCILTPCVLQTLWFIIGSRFVLTNAFEELLTEGRVDA